MWRCVFCYVWAIKGAIDAVYVKFLCQFRFVWWEQDFDWNRFDRNRVVFCDSHMKFGRYKQWLSYNVLQEHIFGQQGHIVFLGLFIRNILNTLSLSIFVIDVQFVQWLKKYHSIIKPTVHITKTIHAPHISEYKRFQFALGKKFP